jgi:hypothetical protein
LGVLADTLGAEWEDGRPVGMTSSKDYLSEATLKLVIDEMFREEYK